MQRGVWHPSGLTALGAKGCIRCAQGAKDTPGGHEGSEGSKGAEGKVDGASPRGLWPPDGGGLCRRVVKRKVLKMDGPSAQGFLSLTALRAEGCGIALTVHSEHILKER